MKVGGRFRPRQEDIEFQSNFMEDIEQSLIKNDHRHHYGIDEFEKVYEKKKIICEALTEFHDKNKLSKANIMRARQRLYQIEQLTEKADRHSMLLKNQIEKINDAHMMNKILTIEKMIRMKKQHQDSEQRKHQIFRIKAERERAEILNRSRKEYRTQKYRQMSLLDSKTLKHCIEDKKYQTIQEKRCIAERVREDKNRIRERAKRYEQFKIDQGKKNYQQKINQLKFALEDKEKKLDELYRDEIKEEKHFQTTEQVTKEFLGTMFPTQTI